MTANGNETGQREIQPLPPSRQLPAEGGSTASGLKIVTIRPDGNQTGSIGAIIREIRRGAHS